MDATQPQPAQGSLSWRLSAHPITLLTFLAFRIGEFFFFSPLATAFSKAQLLTHVQNAASILVYFLGGLLLTDSMCVYTITLQTYKDADTFFSGS